MAVQAMYNRLFVSVGLVVGMPEPSVDMGMLIVHSPSFTVITGPDDAMAMSSANGLVGTGFASPYRLQSRANVLRLNG